MKLLADVAGISLDCVNVVAFCFVSLVSFTNEIVPFVEFKIDFYSKPKFLACLGLVFFGTNSSLALFFSSVQFATSGVYYFTFSTSFYFIFLIGLVFKNSLKT